MTLEEFLSRLQGVKSSGGGQYMAKCPCHDDKQQSLGVAMGNNGGIVLQCYAGCKTEEIVAAMGLRMADLFPDKESTISPKKKQNSKPKAQARPAPAPATAAAASDVTQQRRIIEATYDYTDEDGQLLFQVVRYNPKGFKQRQPDGVNWRWTIKDVRPVVYQLPAVIAAIAADKPVFVVEGEKDANNMALLGYVATTSPMGAGKWKPDHSQQLAGGRVYILPDNDDPGRMHAQQVAASLNGVAAFVSILDLAAVCDALPEKGDVTDFFHELGRERGMLALEQLMQNAQSYVPVEEGLTGTGTDERTLLYSDVYGYGVINGSICRLAEDGKTAKQRLSTFVAIPREHVIRDDGVNTENLFVLDGWTQDGRQLPRLQVPAAKFGAMQWAMEGWGFAANIAPGQATVGHLRYAIMEVGRKHALKRTVYAHTGWRKVGQDWVYLYNNGSIGAARNVSVELDGQLAAYDLDHGKDLPLRQAQDWSFNFGSALNMRVGVPLQGAMYLAPLREFLAAAGVEPSFAVFLLGGTGTRKSTVAALALSHFGNFTARSLPASFNDTSNYIRKKAFLLKDAPIVVDDYHPVSNAQSRRRMEDTAQSLARAFGDGAERGRMRADLSLAASMPPRGICVMSGEDMPAIGESGSARYYVVNVTKDDVKADDILTDLQEKAREGYFARAMRGYIEWLIPQVDALPEKLASRFYALRRRAIEEIDAAHGRVPEAVAHIMLGYEMMCAYMVDAGALTKEDAELYAETAWKEITENSNAQSADIREERPAKIFLRTMGELLSAKRVNVLDLANMDGAVPRDMVGYVDQDYYYFLPDMAFTAVSKLMADQGAVFPLTRNGLLKQLAADKLCVPDGAGTPTRLKKIGTTPKRVLFIARGLIDGGNALPPEQKRLDLQQEMEIGNDLTPVADTENPFIKL